MFTTKSNYVMGILFSALFGDINEEKAEVVAKAFQDKIESLIENEKYSLILFSFIKFNK